MKKIRKTLLSILVTMAIAVGLASGQVVFAQEEQDELTLIEYEEIEQEGENYGYVATNYRIPKSKSSLSNGGGPSLNGNANFPSSYDARVYGHVSEVKDQSIYGTCWAFATISAAESDAIIDGRATNNVDYSELQLAYYVHNPVGDPLGGFDGTDKYSGYGGFLHSGGNMYMSTFSMTSWISPVDESVMDYDTAYLYDGSAVIDDAYAYQYTAAHLQNAYWISMNDTASIKSMIMKHGSIYVSLDYQAEYVTNGKGADAAERYFYNPVNYTQNHAVSLVGWNDKIPASNFKVTIDGKTYTPKRNGAWLVKNSHGKDTPINNEGYFWVSYDDVGLHYSEGYYGEGYDDNLVCVFDFESVDNYDYNYQYDGDVGFFEVTNGDSTMYGANVFTVSGGPQSLDAVGFYTTSENMSYSIQIYKVTDDGTPVGQPLLSKPVQGKQAYVGYHTVKLNETIVLDENESFSVVIKFTADSGYDYCGMFADCVYEGEYGKSYYSDNGYEWYDMYDVYGATNRIKAYTSDTESETMFIDRKLHSMYVGDTVQLAAYTIPANPVTNKVTWKSSNTKVVTIDKNGLAIGVGEGQATITATLNGSTDTCQITVKKEEGRKKKPTPPKPVLTYKSENIIAVDFDGTYMYSLDGMNWQDIGFFTGLEEGTEYRIYAMNPGDENYDDSDDSEPLVVKTYSVIDYVMLNYVNIAFTLEDDVEKTIQLTATVVPSDVMVNTVTWESEDESVAKVDQNGLVTAVGEGETMIKVKADGNSNAYTYCCVSVHNIPDGEYESSWNPTQTNTGINLYYRTHIQSYGWEGNENNIYTWRTNGVMSGTSGLGKRLEGINIVIEPNSYNEELDLGIKYTTHCQSYGWLPWSADGDMSGTEGEGKRLEAIMIELTGEDASRYDVFYRVHAQTFGWLAWTKNGEPSGTVGCGKRLEGIQIVIVEKGKTMPVTYNGITSDREASFIATSEYSLSPQVPGKDMVNVAYRTHVQSFGWQGWKYNGQMSGTSGLAKRLEGIEINVTNKDYDGGVAYCTHVQTYAWQGADLDDPTTWKQDGEMAGTSGEAKRLEAICITLTGEMADHYDIYYRVHAQSYGWLGWAKNGAPSGTAGYGKRLEGIQIVVVPKGQAGPANTYMGVTSVKDQAYVQK